MKKGGYQIIDLKNTPLTSGSGAMVIDGIYSSIESTNKAILFSGIVIDGVEYNDTFVELTEDGSNYVGTMYGKTITIQDNDVVSVDKGSNSESKVIYDSGVLELSTTVKKISGLTEKCNLIVFTAISDSDTGPGYSYHDCMTVSCIYFNENYLYYSKFKIEDTLSVLFNYVKSSDGNYELNYRVLGSSSTYTKYQLKIF